MSAFLTACAKEKVIALKENIHHDDFEYSVRAVEKAGQIGEIKARGIFFIVTFQVENRARRVAHDWDNNVAYVIDDKDIQHENERGAQEELNRLKPFGFQDHYRTGAGVRENTRLVFDLPVDTKEPYLKVRGEPLMGDVFDGCQFRKTKVKLATSEVPTPGK